MGRPLTSVVVATALIAATAGTGVAGSSGRAHAGPGSAATSIGGQIYVDGAGDVRVSGDFLAFGDVGGMKVTITDRGGDARTLLAGRRILRPLPRSRPGPARPRTVTFGPGPRQRVTIEGRDVVATFRGDGNVTLSITGQGSVRLDGVGTFRVNNAASESWPLRPIRLPLRPASRRGQG